MTLSPVPDRALAELGRTEGGPDTLALLVRDQDTRRLLLLRAVLDAAEGADAKVCSADARARVREDWALLAEADQVASAEGGAIADRGSTFPGDLAADPASASARDTARDAARDSVRDSVRDTTAGPTANPAAAAPAASPTPYPAHAPAGYIPPHTPLSPARARLLHPLVGPWARRCLRELGAAAGPPTAEGSRELGHDLAHFSALAAVAAARAGISYAVRLSARDGVLVLPSLGVLRTAAPGDVPVDVVHRRGRLTLRQSGAADITVRLESGTGAWSAAPAWTPSYALPGLLSGAGPMQLDDLDPYRTTRGGQRHHGLSGPTTLDDAGRKCWLHSWSGTAAALGLGGEQRVGEAVALLRCLVPLADPPGSAGGGRGGGSCSGTRREAFGAVLSSTPPTPATFAATLVHELQHTKLAALSDMLTLHHAGPQQRYFAPWRPDPRPYDGLLQGAYSHLALADFFQRCALTATRPAHRESAWTLHARYQEQVGAVLPTLVGSGDLTARGRRFVDQMVAVHERLEEHPPPRGQAARARAYVAAARALWAGRRIRPTG
ncbi:HEXXH motif-containing putative peptide modification protein [Streptomyces sp. NBC_01356]|uniref:aKG-HExxH-type peptide beta-hydroxylase n=1 Tax=Streptomyces sp. NBC_01356 TaxID=2903836 RepID=UPI002E35F392|nr:HEXXH motif-containing putative peptide modification protein [Streptomyces sp. NBC_01356]